MFTCPGRRATPRAKTAHFVNRTKFVTQHPNIPCNFRLKRFFWETRPFLTSPLLYSSFCHFLLTFEVRRAKVLFETWRKPRDPWRKKRQNNNKSKRTWHCVFQRYGNMGPWGFEHCLPVSPQKWETWRREDDLRWGSKLHSWDWNTIYYPQRHVNPAMSRGENEINMVAGRLTY